MAAGSVAATGRRTEVKGFRFKNSWDVKCRFDCATGDSTLGIASVQDKYANSDQLALQPRYRSAVTTEMLELHH